MSLGRLCCVLSMMMLLVAAMVCTPSALAQGGLRCERQVTVQAGEWLAYIAERELGDAAQYPAIVAATNAQAETDAQYRRLVDVNLIEPGWALCIPDPDWAFQLQVADAEIAGESGPALVNTQWRWRRTVDGAGYETVSVSPGAYTLLLDGNGGYKVRADCNWIQGRYDLDGGSLRLERADGSRPSCAPCSQDTIFLAQLYRTTGYQVSEGVLVLGLGDGGEMFLDAHDVDEAAASAAACALR